MRSKIKFVDEVTGKEFDIEEDALKSENRSTDIQIAFNFYMMSKIKPKDGNDDIGVQRDKDFYNRLLDTLIRMVEKYEPWILKSYEEVDGLTREYVKGYSMLGRFLSDGDSDLYHWWGIQGNICPKCFREYGQMYYALNCKCEGV